MKWWWTKIYYKKKLDKLWRHLQKCVYGGTYIVDPDKTSSVMHALWPGPTCTIFSRSWYDILSLVDNMKHVVCSFTNKNNHKLWKATDIGCHCLFLVRASFRRYRHKYSARDNRLTGKKKLIKKRNKAYTQSQANPTYTNIDTNISQCMHQLV